MSSNNVFKFKPEEEENIVITHHDLTVGLAEVSPLMREIIFTKKYAKKIQKINKERERLFFKRQQQEKRKRENMEEEQEVINFIENFTCSKPDNWLTDDEERSLFIEHFVAEIKLEVEKKQRCEAWVKDHIF